MWYYDNNEIVLEGFMEFKIKMKIGQTELEITDTADNVKQMFKQVAFYNDLPSVGPNGETDVVFRHRVTSKGHEYYSLVSKQANKEFRLGQTKDNQSLYPKGWEELYSANGSEESEGSDGAAEQSASSAFKAASARTESAKPAPKAEPSKPAPQATQTAVSDVLSKYGIKR
jgi:hypothetical protein